ncbi:amidohydrolase family protein [Archangium sp.]|uniref:amidohydrolase family protein n=1 Tax=Archangium sp. TaxID=1872627 RepID=UPI002D50FFFA|nr:amidohydrolase family protein [Archangium sp.]HYO51356.1 amidohydrolase family protein [Archangium sp.]
MIIDAHAHVSPTSYGSTEIYLAQLQQSGISEGVISPGGMLDVRRMGNFVTGKEKPSPVPRNEYVDQSVRSHPELYGLACVDPRGPEAPQILERCLREGFRGLMMSPLVHGFSFPDEALGPLASLCGEYRVPIYSHVAFRPGANTAEFVEMARRFPQTHFVLEHMGAGPADQEASEAAALLDNFFLDTSLGNYLHILETVKRAGASKVIFGSEYPLSHPAVELHKILLLPISDGEREKILSGNIRALLRLD